MVDPLIQGIKSAFADIQEHRYKNAQIPLGDYLQSCLAMLLFHLKDPSLHHYRLNYPEREANLKRIYNIESLPSDSAMREAIDGIRPEEVLECFKVPLQELENQ